MPFTQCIRTVLFAKCYNRNYQTNTFSLNATNGLSIVQINRRKIKYDCFYIKLYTHLRKRKVVNHGQNLKKSNKQCFNYKIK